MTQRNTLAFSTSDFIRKVIGVQWANRACSFEKVDCWGLVVLYYRHVLGIELHQTPDYEAGADFFTCYQGDIVFWRQVDKPVDGGIFVGYRGAQPAHVGLVLNRQALHSRGENGSVRMDSLLVIQRAFTKVEFFEYGAG
ncbi:TPA: NlpC/P60 family protein [Enterobacter hormaechei]|uniref:NlpC/P60 family protein n=1 Tax=Enterobacter hormaechei TaxID=158836 RepID=UPI000649FE16|nr:NlpC/P60 family protein [Enterobacter hormaechei]EJB8192792.1 C40 family peptidase [Enterobacter hormaechei]EKU5339078.1 C40 family peptidase [Enterobacter hormaechei]EKU5343895.1 C40 family peptidase [Enterobacter hormaechei]EKU5420412.1 C40 family peptidase [Enterobacter hormaechei]EKX8239151.1 C40 family peptidase [Enterobacter hormaechei]